MYALLFALVMQPPATPAPELRLEVEPAAPVVVAHDSIRLRARLVDAEGRPVPEAEVRFVPAGGLFEGVVREDGVVVAGSVGVIPVGVVGLAPGRSPVVRRVDVRVVPGPAARIVVEGAPARLVVGQRVPLTAQVLSAAGDRRRDRVTWASTRPAVARVDANGWLEARTPGRTDVVARVGAVEARQAIEVVPDRIARLRLEPAWSQARTGDVVRLQLRAEDAQGRPLAVTALWSFAPGQGWIDQDGAFVGYEPGRYTVIATVGRHQAAATVELRPRDVRRPVEVVGRLPRTAFTTEEVWVHPNGQVAYLGTGSGGDRLYVIDIRDPRRPTVVDSLVVDTRRVNDVMTTPDGRTLVFTREGASSRRNGIVLASLADPFHPKIIAEFTDGVTAGVHSAFIAHQPRYGTHVYLTNDGTGALHIVDISDPTRPREVARWQTARPDAGRMLHDVDVRDGLAYLSYWNDGLVILDVGNGVKGGRPDRPVLVAQYKYDLDDLYREVALASGPGFIRGTHTAWRHGRYVFIADEVFPAAPVAGAKDAAAGRAYGRLQVLDVSDLEHPRLVAWYEPEFGGVHNVWVEGDRLYLGAYNAGFRVFDISGELRGDLRAQRREIAHLNTADMDGYVKNAAMTWGVVVKNGLAYVNDMYNGLWIVRLREEPATTLVP